MSYRKLQISMVVLPTLLIGGFEYIRHHVLMKYLSMETGNLYITLLTFVLSLLFSFWMFRTIRNINEKLANEQAKQAVYEERERLARELHDSIAQTLFFLNVKIKQGKMHEARLAIADIDNQLRQAIFNLRLPADNDSLSKRLEEWLSQWSQMTQIETVTQIELPDSYLTAAEQVHLFGLVQEAFANIRKHAGASLAELRLTALPDDGWQLLIRDNGRGFSEQAVGMQKYGLKMMKERSLQLGAELTIRTGPTGGTELLLRAQERSAKQ